MTYRPLRSKFIKEKFSFLLAHLFELILIEWKLYVLIMLVLTKNIKNECTRKNLAKIPEGWKNRRSFFVSFERTSVLN